MTLQSKTNELPEYLHGRKASEVFLEYAMPAINMLLEGTGNKLNVKELENMLVIPSCIWNKVVAETDTNTNIGCLYISGEKLPSISYIENY